jgi:hypothetical protein
VKTTDDISRVIEELKSKILKGENLLNLQGSNFVATNFRKDKILSELIEEFQK